MAQKNDHEESTQPGFFSLADLTLFYCLGQNAEDSRQGVFQLMQMINNKVDALRVSLVYCPSETQAIVLASSDDENIAGLNLNLTNYPEICEARRTKRAVVISDVYRSELLADVLERLKTTPFESIVALPLECEGAFFGTLSLRMKSKSPKELSYVEALGLACSQIISVSGALEGTSAAQKAA